MGAETKVINLTNGCRIKRSQAYGRVKQCLSRWVEQGFSIEDLSLAESIKARSEQVILRGPLPAPLSPTEGYGLKFDPPPMENLADARKLSFEAGCFASMEMYGELTDGQKKALEKRALRASLFAAEVA